MAVRHLDHVNIRTSDVAGTLNFYRDVLDMKIATPPFASAAKAQAGWLLDENGAAIVHVGHVDEPYPSDARMPFTAAHGSGVVHHVALECSDYDAMLERIQAQGLAFDVNKVPGTDLTQIFIVDPNGVILELNFRG
jgi:catechol 2,3-dioxygenase-like lactoylglutathione lyase family enzyme